MPRKAKKIAVYTGPNVSSGNLTARLKKSFYGAAIKNTNAASLAGDLDRDTLAFFLPGIIGEDSPYMQELGTAGRNRAIRLYVEQGGVFVGICAGAYYACKDILYDPPWRDTPKTGAPGLDFFNGLARGPIRGFGQKGDEYWFSDCTVTNILYRNEDGAGRSTGIAYGNGPMLLPDADEDIEILARYEDVSGQPVAIAVKQVGKGLAFFVGVLPFLGYEQAEIPESMQDLRDLLEQLRPHEQGRENVWNMIISRIKQHNADLGRVSLLPAPAPVRK